MGRILVTLATLLVFAVLGGCVSRATSRDTGASDSPTRRLAVEHRAALSRTGQVLVVAYDPVAKWTRIALLRPRENGFEVEVPEFDGAVGKNGVAPPGDKREGDKRTPSGLFTLTEAFGEDPVSPTKLPYKVVTPEDAWCEDPSSPDYNAWVKLPVSAGGDRLKRDDDLYVHALVVDYNRNPVVPGMGSAIFVHTARPGGAGTLGCVGMPRADLDRVMGKLDPALSPTILIGLTTSSHQ